MTFFPDFSPGPAFILRVLRDRNSWFRRNGGGERQLNPALGTIQTRVFPNEDMKQLLSSAGRSALSRYLSIGPLLQCLFVEHRPGKTVLWRQFRQNDLSGLRIKVQDCDTPTFFASFSSRGFLLEQPSNALVIRLDQGAATKRTFHEDLFVKKNDRGTFRFAFLFHVLAMGFRAVTRRPGG